MMTMMMIVTLPLMLKRSAYGGRLLRDTPPLVRFPNPLAPDTCQFGNPTRHHLCLPCLPAPCLVTHDGGDCHHLDLCRLDKGQVTLPKQMNFQKSSKEGSGEWGYHFQPNTLYW